MRSHRIIAVAAALHSIAPAAAETGGQTVQLPVVGWSTTVNGLPGAGAHRWSVEVRDVPHDQALKSLNGKSGTHVETYDIMTGQSYHCGRMVPMENDGDPTSAPSEQSVRTDVVYVDTGMILSVRKSNGAEILEAEETELSGRYDLITRNGIRHSVRKQISRVELPLDGVDGPVMVGGYDRPDGGDGPMVTRIFIVSRAKG